MELGAVWRNKAPVVCKRSNLYDVLCSACARAEDRPSIRNNIKPAQSGKSGGLRALSLLLFSCFPIFVFFLFFSPTSQLHPDGRVYKMQQGYGGREAVFFVL
jgi:hypothetical protein